MRTHWSLCLWGGIVVVGLAFAGPAWSKGNPKNNSSKKPPKQKQLTEEQSKSLNPQTPHSMTNVFTPPKRAKSKPQVFDFLRYCGRNDVEEHKVYICVLEDGRVFGGIPANIDQNDKIFVYLIARKWLAHLYKVQMVRKKSLNVMPTTEAIPLSELKPKSKAIFIVRKYVFGPFPPGQAQLAISRPPIARPGLGRVYTLRTMDINPLVQFNVGVAFIGIGPVRTQFGLFRERGSSLTRIARKEQGAFQLDFILIAKIYSWQVWDKDLFAGRDVLKPPSFLQRININLGFSFQDLFQSFFLGIGFEVNRGLDIVVGVNLRTVDVLTGGFEEGNLFSGDEIEIPVRKEIQPALYIGVSITTEIFQSIFKLLSGGSLFK